MDQASRGARGHDAPIETREDDLLGGYRVANAMHRVLATGCAQACRMAALSRSSRP